MAKNLVAEASAITTFSRGAPTSRRPFSIAVMRVMLVLMPSSSVVIAVKAVSSAADRAVLVSTALRSILSCASRISFLRVFKTLSAMWLFPGSAMLPSPLIGVDRYAAR